MSQTSHRIHQSLAIVITFISSCLATQEGFFAVAHMTNGYRAVKYAMDAGANAVELDLKFNSVTGLPTIFYHGSPCDCTCYRFIPFSSYDGNLCSLYHKPCNTASDYKAMLNYLLQFRNLALIYLDSKIGDFPGKIQKQAAKNVIQLIEESLFSKGYKGKVLIGGEDKLYLTSVADHAEYSKYEPRIYVTLDKSKEGTLDSLKFLTNVATPNVVFSDGDSLCNPRTFRRAIRTAGANKINGVISKVFVWTVDFRRSFDIYYVNGARGIVTNKIGLLMRWVRDHNIRLAVPGDDSLMPATSSQIINPICDCSNDDQGGCKISKLPPKNTACHCKKNILRQCSGYVVMCKDPNSRYCIQPEYSVHTCIEGGGNCDGYENGCDCSYKWRWRGGGCQITKPAPIHTACDCHQRLLSCHGHLVRCKNPNALQCKNPDTTETSCILGGGDCGGY